jgi:hypothetical protein
MGKWVRAEGQVGERVRAVGQVGEWVRAEGQVGGEGQGLRAVCREGIV